MSIKTSDCVSAIRKIRPATKASNWKRRKKLKIGTDVYRIFENIATDELINVIESNGILTVDVCDGGATAPAPAAPAPVVAQPISLLATQIVDELIKDPDYDPVSDPNCYGKPRSTYGGNDTQLLKDASYMMLAIDNITPRVAADLNVIDFSTENVECFTEVYCGADTICGLNTLPNGRTYLGVTGGGDWELPIFFIVYHDGTELRGYVPKDGNTWNHIHNHAFGNADDDDVEEQEFNAQFNTTGDWRDQDVDVDVAKIIADIQANI